MNGYKEFWNKLFYGSDQGFAGTSDVTEYWLRIAVIVAVCLLAGVASLRFGWIPGALTALFIGVWALSVGPFIVRAASCGGCGSASSYDTARSYEGDADQLGVGWHACDGNCRRLGRRVAGTAHPVAAGMRPRAGWRTLTTMRTLT